MIIIRVILGVVAVWVISAALHFVAMFHAGGRKFMPPEDVNSSTVFWAVVGGFLLCLVTVGWRGITNCCRRKTRQDDSTAHEEKA